VKLKYITVSIHSLLIRRKSIFLDHIQYC